ncbi:MAG: pentapeptide repeat-containing protein [Candidatus Omnitrophica bacterium]|nr:pentapeptide repeat-containing protein [Candidatus Omnitrophota bacterium]
MSEIKRKNNDNKVIDTESDLFDADLKGANLLGANLVGKDLTGANLEGADLNRANLSGARLWHANLRDAKLSEANLSGADFWGAKLCGAQIWNAELSGAKSLTRENFLEQKGRKTTCGIDEKGYRGAAGGYRLLKQHFLSKGRYDDVSWASFREKTMEKGLLRKNKEYLRYLACALMGLLCGWGEKPNRVILSSTVIVLLYSFLYTLLNATQALSNVSLKLWDNIYFSIVTFTTVGYGDIIPLPAALPRLLAASEGFLGAFMIGLFVFSLAKKYSAR